MKTKIHYIITALLAIYCGYLAWQLQGVKKYLEVQTELLHNQSELNQTVFEHIERLSKR